MQATIREFLKRESASGILLMVAAILAMAVANSPLHGWYELLFNIPVEIRIGALLISKPLILWINDGLMAVFFFLIGLELKREIVEVELSRRCISHLVDRHPVRYRAHANGARTGAACTVSRSCAVSGSR